MAAPGCTWPYHGLGKVTWLYLPTGGSLAEASGLQPKPRLELVGHPSRADWFVAGHLQPKCCPRCLK